MIFSKAACVKKKRRARTKQTAREKKCFFGNFKQSVGLPNEDGLLIF
jgi:hypothetical protein